MRRIALVLLLLVLALPANCQNTDFQELFSGHDFPLTLKLKDLNGDWRKLAVSGQNDIGHYLHAALSMFGSNPRAGTRYTKGETVTVGGETYLIAYAAPMPILDFAALTHGGFGTVPIKWLKLTPETPLTLSLLNLRTSGSLTDIRPFDLNEELAENAKEAGIVIENKSVTIDELTDQLKAASTTPDNNLKRLALGVMMYLQDYDEVFPPMKSAAALKKSVKPYVKNERIFVQPDTKQPYLPNPRLARKELAKVKSPAKMAMLYEASPAPDGTRGVAFADGHVKRIPETDWPALKKSSGVP